MKRTARADGGLGATVGQNVRAERERLGISVRELARRLGVSASFLSQFELGQSKAAVNTLFAIASELNLSLDKLLGSSVDTGRDGGPAPARPLTLADKEGAAEFEEYLTLQNGVRWKRLADMPANHHVQFLLTEYDPGSDSAPGDVPQRHPGDDYGYVLEGTLTVDIDGKERTLSAGEAIHLRGDVPHRLRNTTEALVRAVWFVVS
ncbi:cupin domain-containing protein [Aeromicrobium sp.]|uniref:helix-turn-helix domain-containing protein n=1 Tax=Aeromicrobium sp. TaxID=1871063 RepID=UPI0019A0AFAF|nr:cupin domain-containing protein [Aeromicrobium sp.]MBC7630905.1 cupin domain-containing protein [Aeromicrobium sp.]